MSSRPPLPGKLIPVFILLALNVLSELWQIREGLASTATYIGMALNLFLLVGLMRGSEAARTLGMVVAWLSLIGGLVMLLQFGPFIAVLGAAGYVLASLPLLVGGYLLWSLGQEDVKNWLYHRAYGEE